MARERPVDVSQPRFDEQIFELSPMSTTGLTEVFATVLYSRLTYLNLCLLHFLTYWNTLLNNTLYRFRGIVFIREVYA